MEATFCTPEVLLQHGLYQWLLLILNIIASTFGSHFLYTRCYYLQYSLYHWLLLTLNIIALTLGSHFLYTRGVTTAWLVSMVTTHTEHNSFNIWKPLFVHCSMYHGKLTKVNILASNGSYFLYTRFY